MASLIHLATMLFLFWHRRLNATWESIETITEYFNYISESLASFQQHRANLSSLYDNVILKQQETIQRHESSNAEMTGVF